jgi:hypothetical protein
LESGWASAGGVFKPESQIEQLFKVEQPVTGLKLGLTSGPEYGIVKVEINGHVVAEGVDLYAETTRPGPAVPLSAVQLNEGLNTITFKAAGENPRRTKGNVFLGFDYLQLAE